MSTIAPELTAVTSSLASTARQLATLIRFGATVWVTAPGLEDHARHLAVEFVHPASVGARAVPAVALVGDSSNVISDLRWLARAGDVVVSLGDADTHLIGELALRSQAWQLTHVHVGWSNDGGVALDPSTHFVRIGASAEAERTITRCNHLLWELIFICFQNDVVAPRVVGGTSNEADPSAIETRSCAVCADEAVVAEVQRTAKSTADVRTACGPMTIDVSLVDNLGTYDLVLVHAGIAIRRLRAH